MKKLIAISVVFALVAGVAFAVDLGGSVVGHVNLIETDFNGGAVNASAGFDHLKLEGAGEAGEGKFGGWIRFEPTSGAAKDNFSFVGLAGIAWWKPIDQFKLSLGGNPDGVLGQGGFSGWGLNQTANDGIAMGTGNIWGWGETVAFLQTRHAFYDGFDDARLYMEIKPFDMLAINVAIPLISGRKLDDDWNASHTAEDVFASTMAQLALNFDFGNIAITFDGNYKFPGSNGYDPAIFLYYGGSFGDLSIDFGVAYHLSDADTWHNVLFAGLGLKYTAGAFGIKFRSVFGIPTQSSRTFDMLFDLVPSFAINDNIAVFLNAGVGISGSKPDFGWYVNPYIRVGAEWGPTFYAGIQVGNDKNSPNWETVKFAIPIGIQVGF
jgi:hypothetical protein